MTRATSTTTVMVNGQPFTMTHFPYDPSHLQSRTSTTPFLVQHGMEYNPIAINEVLAFPDAVRLRYLGGAPADHDPECGDVQAAFSSS